MEENSRRADVWEKIFICTQSKSESNEEDILSDFELLDFANDSFHDPSDINYNGGQKANEFDKIAKYYGRNKNVFLFVSLLRKDEFSKKIMDLIQNKCDGTKQANFIERVTLYLNRISNGERDAKKFLKNEDFPEAFFNGCHCGENRNIHENLNVNFTLPTQFLDIANIFNRKIDAMCKEKSHLRRLKIYDNGRRAVTVVNDQEKRIYNFASGSSCQLVIKKADYELFLDFVAGKLFNIELKIEGFKTDPRDVLATEKIINNNEIRINHNSLIDVLQKYFSVEKKVVECPYYLPECLPITNLKDLYTWKASGNKHSTENLRPRVPLEFEQKTLVCHDMKGGYLDDRYINGTKEENPFYFLHWQNVDIFVYFSHNFVTIPPCNWISAAHRNGVQILGTFITEWDDGLKICEEFLKDEKTVLQLTSQLVNIAVHCNFDGWLINIENQIKIGQIPLLRKFVSTLTSEMHMHCPGSQVIWYDSVIKNGELKWQNALNDANRIFFLACDGIFLNYNWKEEHLLQSAESAGYRKTDVYVGVDVFGRGCLGGGGFSTDIAVAEARKFGLSVAIFAPGWVYECLDVKDFKENQFKFWNALQKYCPARKLSELSKLSFCPGFGKKMFRDGKIISDKPWSNLGLQSLQPIYSSEEGQVMTLYNDDAFNGGGCLHLSGVTNSTKFIEFNILLTDTLLPKQNFIISYTFKPLLSVDEFVLKLNSSHPNYFVSDNYNTKKCNIFRPSLKEDILKAGYDLKEAPREKESWITRTYVVRDPKVSYESSISVLIYTNSAETPVSALFGELEIIPLTSCHLRYRDLKHEYFDDAKVVVVQCLLEWKEDSSILCSDIYVQVNNGEKEYIATTSQFNYKLEYLILCDDSSCGNLYVIVCSQIPGKKGRSSTIRLY